MARPTTTGETLPKRERQARLAAALRSNLRKRKQQARRRAEREADAATAPDADERNAPAARKGPGGPEGGPA